MAPAQKEKKASSSLPCEVFFACTRCGSRSRTVPQLYTHYRSVHKDEIANGSIMSKEGTETKSKEDGAAKPEKGKVASPVERPRTRSQAKSDSPAKKQSSKKDLKDKQENASDVIYVEGSEKKPGPVINHPEKDCVITRKRNVPLGMLEGKKNSLMVIFQHSDQNKPLPEGSSFKLRNTGGEQTYLVVANVDVDIIEQGRPPKKAKTGKRN